jgi:Flp pilus assembly protein TadD
MGDSLLPGAWVALAIWPTRFFSQLYGLTVNSPDGGRLDLLGVASGPQADPAPPWLGSLRSSTGHSRACEGARPARTGDRLRITVQLVEATGGMHLWAERYDRPAEHVFAIQDEVVRTVAATLAGRLEATGAATLRRRPPSNLSAYECVLRGNALPVNDPANEAAALRLFEQAVALDPEYAVAHAQLAISYTNRWQDDMNRSNEDLDRAFELATRAIRLDAQESVCHTALGFTQLNRRRYDEAEFHARKALALNPNRPNALAFMAQFFAACHAQLSHNEAMRAATAEVMRLQPDFSIRAFMVGEP